MTTKYQIIILTLSDGREIKATVPAFCEVGDEISVTTVEVTPPKEMEPGYSWSDEYHKQEATR